MFVILLMGREEARHESLLFDQRDSISAFQLLLFSSFWSHDIINTRISSDLILLFSESLTGCTTKNTVVVISFVSVDQMERQSPGPAVESCTDHQAADVFLWCLPFAGDCKKKKKFLLLFSMSTPAELSE